MIRRVLPVLASLATACAPTGAGGADAAVEAPRDMAGPRRLSWTGLYADASAKRVAPDVLEYQPAFALWSDGSEKPRWLRLPPGAVIDTRDMDHWQFPVGTKLWKEFRRDGRRLETRLLEHVADTGRPETDWFMGAFLWLDDESDAIFVEEGASDVRDTDHDVPAADRCWKCHNGEPGHVLGFSALQLSGAGPGTRLDALAAAGRLSAPPPRDARYQPPGDTTARAALGYLHANCGHCHNPEGTAWPVTDLVLRLWVDERDVAATRLYRSTVGVPLIEWKRNPDIRVRIVPGQPDASGVAERMTIRGDDDQMPPLATEHVDPDGIGAVRAWIQSLR